MYVRAQNFVHDFVHLSVYFVHQILYMYKTVPPKMYMHRNQTCDKGENVHIQNKLYIILYTRLPKMYTRLYILLQNMYMVLRENAKKGPPQIAYRIALVNNVITVVEYESRS